MGRGDLIDRHVTAARQPRYWVATLLVAAIALGLPPLLFSVDSLFDRDVVDAGAVQTPAPGYTYQAPAGWENKGAVGGGILLGKGGATIDIPLPRTFTGSPTDLYRSFIDELDAIEQISVTSSSDPHPATLGGLDAVSGTIHFLFNGTDNTGFVVVGVGDGFGIVADLFGPVSDIKPLEGEYEDLLASIKVTGP